MSQNGYITLTPGFYTCPVDGFLLGLANGTSATCIAYAWAMCGAAGVWATGGSVNIGNDSNGNAIIVSNGNTLFLPIPAGNEFAFGDGITSYGSQPSTVVFYYLPNGDGVPTPVQNPTLQKPALPQTPPALIAR
jgi:hypothetical protein